MSDVRIFGYEADLLLTDSKGQQFIVPGGLRRPSTFGDTEIVVHVNKVLDATAQREDPIPLLYRDVVVSDAG